MDAEHANTPRAAMLENETVAGGATVSSDVRIEDHFSGSELELARAAGDGDTSRVQQLIGDGVDPDAISGNGMPLILWPLHRENLEGVKALLAAGANPDQRARTPEGQGGSPVIIWAARQQDAGFLEAFIRAGAELRVTTGDGSPLVREAMLAGNWTGVQRLVEAGADINAILNSSEGSTVLGFYAGIGAYERVHWLLVHGADPGYRFGAEARANRVGAQPILEDLYWRPLDPARYPEHARWREKVWSELRKAGHQPPPEPANWRRLRERMQLEDPHGGG